MPHLKSFTPETYDVSQTSSTSNKKPPPPPVGAYFLDGGDVEDGEESVSAVQEGVPRATGGIIARR